MSDKIHRAADLVEDLIIEFEHIQNLLEVLSFGFDNDHNDCKECEISSIYILSKYIDTVPNPKLLSLSDLLESMK